MNQENTVVNYKCPNCGGPLVFAIDSQKWACSFCGSAFTQSELANISATTTTEAPQAPQESTTNAFNDEEAMVYTCPDCGGQVVTDKNTVATFCAYCHNPTVIAARLTGQDKPQQIIPFKITKEQALETLNKLIRKKPLLPGHFKSCVKKGEITGLYVPFWLFNSDANIELSATSKNIARWSDSEYDYTKTDVYNVERQGVIPVRNIPVDASTRMDDKMMDAIEPFDYRDLTGFSMEYLSGHMAESYDVEAAASQTRFQERTRKVSRSMAMETIRGYSVTSVNNFSCQFLNTEYSYAMLPVWTISIKYGDKIYAFLVNAQTGKNVGKLPISFKRVMGLLLSIMAGVTIVASIAQILMGVLG